MVDDSPKSLKHNQIEGLRILADQIVSLIENDHDAEQPIDNESIKIFRLYDGKVINKEKSKINVFKFDQIDFNLADYSTNTILVPKVQEQPSFSLIKCEKFVS